MTENENEVLMSINRNYEEELANIRELNAYTEEQIKLLEKRNELLVNFSEIQTKTINTYQDLMSRQVSLYEEIIEQEKPSFFEEVKKGTTWMTIGGIIVLLLI